MAQLLSHHWCAKFLVALGASPTPATPERVLQVIEELRRDLAAHHENMTNLRERVKRIGDLAAQKSRAER